MIQRRIIVFVLASVLVFTGIAATAQMPEKVDLDAINKIKEEGLNHSHVMDTLSYLTDVIGQRLTGSPNMYAANEWTKKQLTEWGLQNAHLESWGPFGRGWTLDRFEASAIEPQAFPLIAYPKAWSASTNGPVTGQVVLFNPKTEADLEKFRGKLKGALVFMQPIRELKAHFDPQAHRYNDEELLTLANAGMPGAGGRGGGGGGRQITPEQRAAQDLQRKKMQMVFEEGAAVLFDAGGNGDGGTLFVSQAALPQPADPAGPRVAVYSKDAPRVVPQVVIAAEQYNRIVRMIDHGVPVQLQVNLSARYQDKDLNNYNTIAEIPGTDLKDEIVMLGAHMDSWHAGTGATDNGAGDAVCMEAVRILQAVGLRPRRTIRIGLWSGEEEGLLGSRAYVAEHFGGREPAAGQGQQAGPLKLKPEQEKMAGYFNLDNGTGKIRGIYLQGNESVRPIFRSWLAPFKDLGADTISLANTGGTDHQSFDAVDIPGFQFIQDTVDYNTRTHHSNMDVYDRIQADDMKQASVIMAAFIYNAAMRDQKLPRKPLPAAQPPAR